MLHKAFLVLFALFLCVVPAFCGKFRPRVPYGQDVRFVLDRDVSDDFQASELNLTKWDPHGVRNPNNGCPRWNGPPSRSFPGYSTYFPTTTDPATGARTEKHYRLNRGKLIFKMSERPLEYFTAREYYCDATTFKCNYDGTTDCFATDSNGNPRYADAAQTRFAGVVHDKCKREPFCIPHPEFVTGEPRVYGRHVGVHLTGKKSFKYGYVEVMVKLGRSPAVAGAWMHDDNLSGGYCRLRRNPSPGGRPLNECPNPTRSRRWQEIDLLEVMNSEIHKRRFTPNIHVFSGYKGEFTSSTASDNGDGSVGGGPIVVDRGIFGQGQNPDFSDIPESARRNNEMHLNPGSVNELDADWAARRRMVGLYWSPTEIRFLIDGQEVYRLRNNLIHQPMFLDMTYALNVAWAQQFPTARNLRQEVKFYHYRRWQVFTADGSDPPSSLPLDDRMDRRFQDLYGDQLGGVFGRFPVNDGQTVFQSQPDRPDVMAGAMRMAGSAARRFGPEAEGPARAGVRQDEAVAEADNRRLNVARRPAAGGDTQEALLALGFLHAGGEGNRRYTSGPPAMNQRERDVAESREDRVAWVGMDGKADMLEDGARTAYEFADPNMDGAGWSTPGGLGLEGMAL